MRAVHNIRAAMPLHEIGTTPGTNGVSTSFPGKGPLDSAKKEAVMLDHSLTACLGHGLDRYKPTRELDAAFVLDPEPLCERPLLAICLDGAPATFRSSTVRVD